MSLTALMRCVSRPLQRGRNGVGRISRASGWPLVVLCACDTSALTAPQVEPSSSGPPDLSDGSTPAGAVPGSEAPTTPLPGVATAPPPLPEPPSRPFDSVPSARPALSAEPACDASVDPEIAPASAFEAPLGWASLDDLGQPGTSGGQGGAVVLARTLAELADYAGRAEPLIIQVCGLLAADPALGSPALQVIAVASDKTVIGVGTRPTLRVGLDLFEVSNVVLKNVFIEGAVPDGIAARRSHHLWIDHVDISDSSDGNLDVSNGSDYVTVSYSRFWYRDPTQPHRFSNLIGSSDNAPADVGKLRVTLHHNWWADNVDSRMPRARYGDVHVFNNYYTSVASSGCIFAGTEAELLIEGNYFQRAGLAIALGGGAAFERDNIFDATAGPLDSGLPVFDPPYQYTLDPTSSLPEALVAETGPQAD